PPPPASLGDGAATLDHAGLLALGRRSGVESASRGRRNPLGNLRPADRPLPAPPIGRTRLAPVTGRKMPLRIALPRKTVVTWTELLSLRPMILRLTLVL